MWMQKWAWTCRNSGYIALASLLVYLNHAHIIDLWEQWGPEGPLGEGLFVIVMARVMAFACYFAREYIRKLILVG